MLARTGDDGNRFYPWGGENYWSVTTLIQGGVPKFALAPWSAKVVAELVAADIAAHGPYARAHAAVRRWSRFGRDEFIARQAAGELKSLKLAKLTDLDLALRWLKREPDRVRDTAADIGSDVHSEAEAQVLRLANDTAEAILEDDAALIPEWPEHLAGQERAFKAFLREWRPTYIAAEATVFNRPEAYAGTLDAIAKLRAGDLMDALARVGDPIPAWLAGHDPNDKPIGLGDYKSGNRLYPEIGMQLSAYARGEFIGLPDGVTEVALPGPIEFGFGLHITPTGYHLRLVDIGDEVFDAFKYAREVYRFRTLIAPTVLGSDLAPVKEKAAA